MGLGVIMLGEIAAEKSLRLNFQGLSDQKARERSQNETEKEEAVPPKEVLLEK